MCAYRKCLGISYLFISNSLGLSHKRKRRKLKSEIWNDYDPVYDGNKIKEAHCKYCKRVFIYTRIAGTSQCIRHLLVCEERAKVNEFLDSVKSAMPQPNPNSVEKWKYCWKYALKAIIKWLLYFLFHDNCLLFML